LEADAELLEQYGATLGSRVAGAVRHTRRERVKEASGGGPKTGKGRNGER
jgi:hypothetical protein